jgi:predicted lipoprotein with Yx(FWY)xxD motif
MRRSAVAGGFAAAMLIVATACGSSATTSTAPSNSAPAQSPSQSQPQSSAGLKSAQSAALGGNIVTDGSGWTLYRFDNDKNNPPTSNCTDQCATMWPAAAAVSDTQVTGVDQNLVGSIKQPGDTNGQDVGQVWYVSTPDGQKAGETAGSSPSTSTNPSGY